jgi:hypothetical protein
MAADIRCYPAVICRSFLNVSYVISKAWETGDIGIDENSETAALVAVARAMLSRRFAVRVCQFTT